MKTCYNCDKTELTHDLYPWTTVRKATEYGCHECLTSLRHKEREAEDAEFDAAENDDEHWDRETDEEI